MSGEPRTLTLTTRHGYAPVTYEQDENGAIHQITLHLPPGAACAGPDGAPVVARDEAAELRAALRRCSNLIQDFLDFGIAPVDRGPARHAVEAARAALAATEGEL